MICKLIHSFAGDKIEKNEMDETCNADEKAERRVQDFGEETGGKGTTGETHV
jgi:hypothetical protein